MDNNYLILSKKLAKKQLVEKIIFELEYAFLISLESKMSKTILINDVKGLNDFTDKEYDILLKEAIFYLKEKKNVILKLKGDNIIWVNVMDTKETNS